MGYFKIYPSLWDSKRKGANRDCKDRCEHRSFYRRLHSKLGIQSQEALIELATLSVMRNSRIFSEYVQNYKIQNQEALVRLAKISASQNGRALSEHIQNYGIQSQGALVEIALVAAAQSG